MEIGIIMIVIFLFTDITIVGICMFAYAGKEKYREGMIFGRSEEHTSELQSHLFRDTCVRISIGRYGCFHGGMDSLACGIYCGDLLSCLWDTSENV